MRNTKSDKLDALLYLTADTLAEMDSEYLDSLDVSDVTIRPSVDRKIYRMIRKDRWEREYGAVFAVLRRAAAVFLVVCTLSFAAAMSIEAVRVEFWNAIVKMFENFISVMYETEGPIPKEIEVKKEPTYLVEEYEKKVVSDTSFSYWIDYCDENKVVISYQQMLFNNEEAWFDNDVAKTLTSVTIHDGEGDIYSF